MFEKSLNEVIEQNCSGCIHKDVCNKAIRLELWDGKCEQRLESNVVYHATYDVRLKVSEQAYIIVGDMLDMSPAKVLVDEIRIKKNGTVVYYIPGTEKQFLLNRNIFKDKKHCLAYIEFLKRKGAEGNA